MHKILGVLAAPVCVATMLASPAGADMRFGNYEVLSDRWTDASWVWAVYPCETPGQFDQMPSGCVLVSALPRPQFGAYYGGTAKLVDGHYSFTSDVPDGLRCPGAALPTRDTYTWDANTLAGSVDSHFDVGCFNGPPGVNTWAFSLTRM
ncbi:hypothetical protein [Mycobacterium sp. pUA109]|uniref:hypothetical protein n=1 Tax=Mycobacterium sp. pUA109 TaxID=3238982 RepID=UPI00351BD68D